MVIFVIDVLLKQARDVASSSCKGVLLQAGQQQFAAHRFLNPNTAQI